MIIFQQPHKMNDSYYMYIIVRKIEKKLNWKKKIFWKDHEYKKLSQLIFEDTTISISPQTLKRLFGKVKYKDDYTSQPATKDALARFLNYTDWETFIQSQTNSIHKIPAFLISTGRKYRKMTIVLILPFVLAILFFFFFPLNNSSNISFKAENVSGITPHTVSFFYNITKSKSKEVYIDFDHNESEDKSGGELLDKERTVINHCFETPGFFNVSISGNGKILKSVKIHALSDGWVSYYFNDDNFRLRKFVFGLEKKVKDTVDDGLLYISAKELNSQGFNGNTVYYLEHMLYREFNLSADSNILEVRYRNTPDMGGISCFDVEFRIIGENGLISIILVQKGCYRWSEIIVGDKNLNGKFNDLSFLSTDLSGWNVLRIKTENMNAVITNGNDTLYSGSYTQALGEVKGIRLLTKGSGAFDYIKLFNNHEKVYYEDQLGK